MHIDYSHVVNANKVLPNQENKEFQMEFWCGLISVFYLSFSSDASEIFHRENIQMLVPEAIRRFWVVIPCLQSLLPIRQERLINESINCNKSV